MQPIPNFISHLHNLCTSTTSSLCGSTTRCWTQPSRFQWRSSRDRMNNSSNQLKLKLTQRPELVSSPLPSWGKQQYLMKLSISKASESGPNCSKVEQIICIISAGKDVISLGISETDWWILVCANSLTKLQNVWPLMNALFAKFYLNDASEGTSIFIL